jgi:hypothetical protein
VVMLYFRILKGEGFCSSFSHDQVSAQLEWRLDVLINDLLFRYTMAQQIGAYHLLLSEYITSLLVKEKRRVNICIVQNNSSVQIRSPTFWMVFTQKHNRSVVSGPIVHSNGDRQA